MFENVAKVQRQFIEFLTDHLAPIRKPKIETAVMMKRSMKVRSDGEKHHLYCQEIMLLNVQK